MTDRDKAAKAKKILDECTEKEGLVDMANLYFAATTFEELFYKETKKAEALVEALEKIISNDQLTDNAWIDMVFDTAHEALQAYKGGESDG